MRQVRLLLLLIFAAALVPAAQRQQTFTGIITDSECPKGDHSHMQMGPTDAECVNACIAAHGAVYVLYDGANVYTLSDQQTPKRFAAQKVRVTGTLNAQTRTIQVESIAAAN